MEKLFLTFLAISTLFLSSCSNPSANFFVWRANNFFSKGEYQFSINNYLAALKKNTNKSYINYNLGNTYYSLGESNAALSEWENAIITKDKKVIFRVLFNRGVLEYELGQYKRAFNSFRSALEIQPDSMDAKVNLEYSLKKMNAGSNNSSATIKKAPSAGDTPLSDSDNRVLGFIKQKETFIFIDSPKEYEENSMDW